MSQTKDMHQLIRARGVLKGKLTRFENYLKRFDSGSMISDDDRNEFKARLSDLELLDNEFNEIQRNIEFTCDEPEQENDERGQFEDRFYKSIGRARSILLNKSKPHSCSSTSSVSVKTEASFRGVDQSENHNRSNTVSNYDSAGSSKLVRPFKIKLPTISMPSFDGSYEKWLEFRDTYLSLVHNVETIDDVCKFHYLKASLHGDAAALIGSLELTAANYFTAWNSLLERFDNNRLLINNYIKALFNIKQTHETSKSLRELVDVFNKNLRSLEILGEPVQSWDTMLIYIVTKKLDIATNKAWEEYRSLSKRVTCEYLLKFLKNRADLLETIEFRDKNERSVIENKSKVTSNNSFVLSGADRTPYKCIVCNGDHAIYYCEKFLKESISRRNEIANKLKLCLNCLRIGHEIKNCKHKSCRICKKRHNTLLHPEDKKQEEKSEQSLNSVILSANINQQTFLSTASVNLLDFSGKPHRVRALLDSGSSSSFVTEKVARILQIPMSAVSTTVTGINNSVTAIKTKCALRMNSLSNTYEANIDCFVIPHITEPLPAHKILSTGFVLPKGLELADPDFCTPGDVDLLLGADIFWELMEPNRIKLLKNQPILQQTKLGWIVAGSMGSATKVHCHFSSTIDIQDQMTKFWELEEVGTAKPWTKEQHECERIFQETTERHSSGRFIVQIPLKQDVNQLGDSFQMAKRRFMLLERRLHKDSKLFEKYQEFLNEYEQLSHMSKGLDDNTVGEEKCIEYFLPHPPVIREESTTTKLRVVFDASAKTTSGLSLNDIQLIGPTIQDDIFSILLRFRLHSIVVSADIAKMYRQVLIKQDQQSLQQILWRNNYSNPLTKFQLKTVTYGTASAPFLAIRCLKQLADEEKDYTIATIIEHDFYVDDLLSGADSVDDATRICEGVSRQLRSGCFELRKWRSNNKEVLKRLSDIAETKEHMFNDSSVAKTLGLLWNSHEDTLGYKIDVHKLSGKLTKRIVLASISQIFDPLGLVAPAIIQAKIFLQRLWLQKLDWDDFIPDDIIKHWVDVVQGLNQLKLVNIPRHVLGGEAVHHEVHIFCDASEVAYGACAYIRSVNKRNTVHTKLLCAKSKVAPLKSTTIPRLELCGALLASKLSQKIQTALRINCDRFVFWSDSSIVLGWLKTQPCYLKTFVANRVATIQETPGVWRYVSSELNPADILSRGTKNLIESDQWWNGPSFLKEEEKFWPTHESIASVELPEQKATCHAIASKTNNALVETILERCSTLTKAKRVLAYVFRFIFNSKGQHHKLVGFLSSDELNESLGFLIKATQFKHFKEDINVLKSKSKRDFPTKSPLFRLQPFLCSKGFVRIRGRLSQSDINYNTRHPIILPKHDQFTTRVFEDAHYQSMHAGPQLLLATVRQKYWPIHGRDLARSIVHRCVVCVKLASRVNIPLMGDLPSNRVSPSLPFEVMGLDYAGPIMMSTKKGRGARLVKSYICLFICFSTKAIHLELSTDVSTLTFLLALKRFIARRGKPSHIYCDNATNFVGAQNLIQDALSNDGIQFHFIPPRAPHFGGLWEAGVKSVKHHLKRILGTAHLTYEELYTVISQIEAILNSRPLTPLSSSPTDFQPLTPGHFLVGRPLTSLPEPIPNQPRMPRYDRIEDLRRHFWRRWNLEYITQLQQRSKWTKLSDNVDINQMVVIKEDNTPPLQWRLGRITKIHQGGDGNVRVAEVRTSTGLLKRPVAKLVKLPVEA